MPRPISEKTHYHKHPRKWATFDRACWKPKPFVPTGELWPTETEVKKPKKTKKMKKMKKSNFRQKRLSMKLNVKMVKNTGGVNEQNVRLNKRIRRISPHRLIRSTKEYRKWRESILHKFNYTCSFCGSMERLELDHIEPVSKRPELIMVDSNARILCKPCHKTTPSYPKSLI